MKLYVALLRGINVSGANRILMLDLRKLFESLGFKKVTTYIQSGNVIFLSKDDNKLRIENLIKSKILKAFGMQTSVIVISKNNFNKTYLNNPFIENRGDINQKKLCVIFLNQTPDMEQFDLIENNPKFPEEIILMNKVIYAHYVNGFGKSKLTNNIIESKLKVIATMRNWRTVTNINSLLIEI